MNYLKEFSILVLCLFLGTVTKHFINFPIPESVYGMVFLFVFIMFKMIKIKDVEKTSHGLLKNLAFFFVPSGVRIISEYDNIKGHTVSIALVIVISTIITTIVTGIVVSALQRRRKNV
ncbi:MULTISPECIES: CidA/LrgA family protein [Peptoniphilus]|uniref:CidA/LrgA family protein n=1 Tax=Peptoniphilus TaxID=162289 RepID=UPI0001DA999E|nr:MULTISPECIES: CidA/LrgA family protein [Peptoniphilus]EFI41720.1 LrgA family protein [Peptoniphilus sp. oral taxon 386 str. F0131]